MGQGDVGMWTDLGNVAGSGECGWFRGSWVVQGDVGGCDSQGDSALLCGCINS